LRNYCRREEDAAHVPTTTLATAHMKIARSSPSVTVTAVMLTVSDETGARSVSFDRNWNVF